MREGPGGRRLTAILILALAASLAAGAQVIAPGRTLYLQTTAHFDIYFPAELAPEAGRLALFADETYDYLSSRFPGGTGRRFPLILADGVASTNGSFSPYPSDRITLLVAPTRLATALGSLDDDLRAVFTHELTHALSLSTRSPFWAGASALLGDPIAPGLWTAPPSFVEGAAVAMETRRDGLTGRANDPMSIAMLRQDMLQDRFKNFWAAAGAWDEYPFGELPYIYGGLFAKRLIDASGPEKYAELWTRLGRGNIFSGAEGGLFMKGAFEGTYGMTLVQAWSEFRSSMVPREPVVMETERLAGLPGIIPAMATGNGILYWVDSGAGAVLSRPLGKGRTSTLFEADGAIERLDLSGDGARLLVSWSRVVEGIEVPLVVSVDTGTGRFKGGELRGLREAAYAGAEALVAISAEGYRSDLVLVRGQDRRVLLRGGSERSYSQPCSPDGKTVYCLARVAGRSLLVRVDAQSGRVETLMPGLPLEQLRSLSLAPAASLGGTTRLALSFAPANSLCRLAIVEDSPPGGQGPSVFRQELELSGSVLQPAIAGASEVIYVGRFSQGEYPCRYPASNPALALRKGEAAWAPLDPSFAAPAALASLAAPERAPAFPLLARSFRFPSVRADLGAAGLVLLGADIAGRLSWLANIQYAWDPRALDLDLELSLGLLPWTLGLGLSDQFSESQAPFTRSSGIVMSLSREWSFLPARRRIGLETRVALSAHSSFEEGAAYSQPWSASSAAAGLQLSASDRRTLPFPPYLGEGAAMRLSLDGEGLLRPAVAGPPALSVETGADLESRFLGLSLIANAALSLDPSLLFGPGDRGLVAGGLIYGSALDPRYPVYAEYSRLRPSARLYASLQASLVLASLELQGRPLGGPLYFQRARIRGGLRGAALGQDLGLDAGSLYLSSAFGALELEGSPLVGMATDLRLHASLEASWAFQSSYSGGPLRIAFALGATL